MRSGSRPPANTNSLGANVVMFPLREPLILEYDLGETINPLFAEMFVKPLMQSTVLNLTVLTVFFTNEGDDDLADLCRFLAIELQREGRRRV